MKTKLCSIAFTVLFSIPLMAGNADDLIQQGRGLLVQHDLWGARIRFEAALGFTNHPDANALLAATRLLSLESTPEGSVLLDRLGFSPGGRTIYNWQSAPPMDTNGIPSAPADFSAAELSAFWRTNVLPTIRASETNLSRITDMGYTLLLNSAETTTEGVMADYGDILLARAMLWFAQYLSYTACSWDMDVQLSELVTTLRQRSATVESVLAAHTNLFTIPNTNDVVAAREAFVKAVELYLQASAIIRVRPQNTIRFFNYDLEMADDEAMFRQTLIDLTNSLAAPVVLAADTNLTVYLAPHFAGQTPSRSFLPKFHENRLLIGSLPDRTFGGVVEGLTRGEIEEWLAGMFGGVIPLTGSLRSNPSGFEISFPTLPQHGYVLQYSTNLLNWTDLAEFVAPGESYTNTDVAFGSGERRFYRLAETSDFIIVSGQVVSRCSGQPLAGAVISTSLNARTAVTDTQGLFSLGAPPRTNGYPFEVYAQAANHLPCTNVIYWDGQLDDLVIGLIPTGISAPANDLFANRIPLVGLPVTAPGTTCGASQQTCEPSYSAGTVWWTWTAPVSAPILVQAFPVPGSSWQSVQVLTGTDPCSLTSVGYSWFNAVAGQTYQIAVGTGSYQYQGAFSLQIVAPQPTLSLLSPTEGAELTAPANIDVQAYFQSFNGALRRAEIYAEDELVFTATNSPIAFTWSNVPPGEYWIGVEAVDTAGQRAYNWTYIWVRPQNDDFANRIALAGTNLIVAGDNNSATREAGEPHHAGAAFASSSLWWTWTAPTDGPVTVSAFGNEHDLGNADFLGVYTGHSLSNLTCVASNAFGIPGYGSQTTFTATMGTSYHIAVDGFEDSPLQLRLLMSPAPQVTLLAPTNGQVFAAGAPITFTAAATNSSDSVDNIAFMDETGVLGYDSTPPYSLDSTAPLDPGFHTLRASALDTSGVISYSEPVTIEVVPAIATDLVLRITRESDLPVIAIAGDIGSQVALEYVAEIPAGTNWQTLTTLTLANSPQFHTDVTAGSSNQRFYRARLLP